MLAGVSVEYYSKLERGALAGVSAPVLEAIASVLQLDDAERAHLVHLAQAAAGADRLTRRRRAPKRWTPSPSLQWVLDAVTSGLARPARQGPAPPRRGRRALPRVRECRAHLGAGPEPDDLRGGARLVDRAEPAAAVGLVGDGPGAGRGHRTALTGRGAGADLVQQVHRDGT